MKALDTVITIIAVMAMFPLSAQTTATVSGNWNSTVTWGGSAVPTSGDVIISDGVEVIYNANHGSSDAVTISSLDVQGTGSLVFPFSDDTELDANFTLTVTGSVSVASTASITNSEPNGGSIPGTATDRTHLFNFEDDITNEGTIDFTGTTTSRFVDVDFQVGGVDNAMTVSGAGNITFYNLDLEAADFSVTITSTGTMEVVNTVDMNADVDLIMNGNVFNVGLTDVDDAFDVLGDAATITLTSGTINIGTSTTANNISPLRIVADACVLNVDGGALNIGNPASGEGFMQIANAAATSFTFDIDGGTTTIADRIDMGTTSATLNLDISAGSLLISTGEGGGESTSSDIYNRSGNSTLNMTGGTLEFGTNADFEFLPTLSGGASLSVGTNSGFGTDFVVDFGAWSLTSGFSFTADGGLDIATGNSVTISSGATLTIESESTTTPGECLDVIGTLTMDGGTVNIGQNVTSSVTSDIMVISDGGQVTINEGTLNILNGLTDASQLDNGDVLIQIEGTGALTVGDGSGGAGTALVNLGTSVGSQASPVSEVFLQFPGDDARMTVNSDATVTVGNNNMGSVTLSADAVADGEEFFLTVQGGTLDIHGLMTIQGGAGFRMTSGTTNIGLESSAGVNDIAMDSNPSQPAVFEMTGGTLNVGDGSMSWIMGNENNTPAFNAGEDGYQEIEISGGTANINGRLRIREQNGRFIVGGGATINFDPQFSASLDPDVNVLDLESGIVQMGTANINFINPHVSTGTGEVLFIRGVGSAGNAITSSETADVAVDFSNITWGMGDGSASSTSTDGFDIYAETGHTAYGNLTVNNPSGTGREVSFINTGTTYTFNDLTLTAGVLDIGDNTIQQSSSNTLLIDASGTLRLNTDFPSTYSTYTLNTGSTVEYNGAGTITTAEPPGSTNFSQLIVSGGGTVNLSSAVEVADTVFLTSGTLAASTNLTMAADAVISLSSGILTGTLQGSNAYSIEYTGSSRSIDPGADPEWTGSGTKSLIADLTSGQTLTVTNTAMALDALNINSGTLTDAGLAHTIAGNLTASDSYTGSGSLALTGGASAHTLASSSGTMNLSNLIMNDANGASGDVNITISGTATLTDGILDIGSGTFTLSSGASITGGGSSTFVAFDGASSSGGMVQTYTTATDSKTYPVGTNTQYTPFTMSLNAASSFGALTVLPVTGGSQFTLDGSNTLDIDYYWLVNDGNNFADVNADYSYTYDDSDVRGAEGNYIAARYDVSNPDWTTSDETTDGSDGVTSNVVTLNGVEFSDGHFTAGEEDEFAGVITTFYLISGVADHDWDNGAHWTNTDGGSTAINRTPGTNSPVVIGGDDVTVDSDGQNAGSITIDSDGIIIIGENAGTPTTGHSFGTVSGTGILRILSEDATSPTFPSENGADWSAFLSASGGTVQYSGDGSYTVPTNGGTYHNLTLTSTSAASTKTLADEDLTISGDLMVSGGFGTTAAFSDATNGNVTLSGDLSVASGDILSFGSTNNRTVTVSGGVTVTGTMNVANSGTATHSLTIGGSLTSAGTFDMNTGGSTVATTFNSSSNASVTGAGSVDFDRLIVNVGSSTATSLTVDVTTFSVTDQGDDNSQSSIELQNGELIISTGATVVLSNNGDVSIPATAALTLNSGSPTFSMETSNAGNLLLNGTLTINSGIVHIGNVTDLTTDNSIRYDGTVGVLTINGGTLNVGGAIRPNVTDASAALTFSLTNDGIVSVARNISTNNDQVNNTTQRSEGDFVLDNAASAFTMSGSNSVLEVVRAETNDGKAISITSAVTNYTVTGGTVKVLQDAHDGFSTNATSTNNDVTVYSSIPLYNLEVGDGDYEGDFGGPDSGSSTALDLQVSNNLTVNINDATTDNGNFEFYRVDQGIGSNNDEWNILVGGNFTVTDGSIQVPSNLDGGTLTFNGTADQTLTTNGQTFGNIVLNKASGSLILADALTIYGSWTHTQGTLNQGGNTITMTTPVGVIGTTISGDPTFDALTLSNTSGVTQASGTTTISSSGVLTISDNVIYDLGDNGLVISNQTTPFAGISIPGGADNTNMIRVSGSDAGTGLTLTYPDASTSGFVFPLGATINATDYYLPGQIDLTAGGGAGATATMVLITSQHPQVTDAENALNLYWSVASSGFNGSQTTTHTYTYGATGTDITEDGNDTDFLDAYNAGSPTFNWTEGSTTNVTGQVITFTDPGSDNIAGDFTAGVDAAFNPVTVYYTIRDGDWNNTTSTTTPWTNDECDAGVRAEVTGIQPTAGDPVVICAANTVTITSVTDLAASGVEINGNLTSQIDNISTLNDISGAGTLAFDNITVTPTLGTLASSFLSGGTLDFGGAAAYTLPTNTNYHNLTLTNANGLTLANDISVTGDVNLSSGSLTMNSFTMSDGDGDGTLTAASGTTMTIDGATNFPSGFGTYSFDAASTVVYTAGNSNQVVNGGITYGNLNIDRTGGNPATRTLTGNIVVAGDLTLDDRTELDASTFDIEIQGNWTMNTTGNSNFDPGSGTVTFSGSGNQTFTFTNGGAESESFNNLTINKTGGTLTFPTDVNDVTVQNTLTVTNGTLQMDDVELVVTGATSIAAGGTLTSNTTIDFNGDLTNAGTFTVPNAVTLFGNFNNSGTYTSASNTLTLDNTSTAQTITGATTFNNLTIAKASGVDVTFNNAVTIDGTLALSNEGNIVLSSGDLTISDGASITGNAGGTTVSDFSAVRMIKNNGGTSDPALIKLASASTGWNGVYPLGVADGTDKYTPVTISASGGTLSSGSLSLRSVNGGGSSTDQGATGSANTLNRHFYTDIAGYSSGTITLDVLFQYDDADVSSGEADFLSAYSVRGTGDGWIRPSASVTNVSAGGNQFGASASLGSDGATLDISADQNLEWIPGNSDLINPRVYSSTNTNGSNDDCSAVTTCDWDDPNSWSLSADGSTADGVVPSSDRAATILSGTTMVLDANDAVAQSTVLEGTLDLGSFGGSSAFGEVTGTGTLQIDASGLENYVDTGSGSTFFGENGGTVEYLGDAAYTLPTVFTEYNNLTIGGTTQDTHDKSLGIGLTIFGNLTLGNTDLENPSNLSLELRGSFTSSGGDFNVADGTFVFSNTVTASLPGDLTFGSSGSLTLDNFGEKDLSGALVIENLTINSSSGTFDANSNTISVTGNWDNQSNTNLLSNPGTVTFQGGDAQQIDGDNTFAAVVISDNTTATTVTVGSGTQTIDGDLTINDNTTLDIGTNTISVSGTFDVGNTSGVFTGSNGTLVITNTTDNQTIADNLTVSTFELQKGSATSTFDNDPQTVTFSNLVITSGEYLGTDLDISSLSIAANGAIDMSGLTSLNLSGDLTVDGSYAAPTTVTLDGSSAQTISGTSPVTFNNLVISNTDAGTSDVTLNTNVTIATSANFVDGLVVPNTGTITFNDNATVSYDGVAETVPTGGSNDGSSYVAGAVTKVGDDNFVFPIGTTTRYARLGITPQTGVATDQYTGVFEFAASPTATATKTGNIVRVSGIEHWDLTQDMGTTDVVPTLFFDATSEVNSLDKLLVAHYTGTEWEDLGNASTTGDANGGTITALTAMSSFSDVTLATEQDNVNALPVEMIYFEAGATNHEVQLEWSTAIEIDNDFFEVQRSLNGSDFEVQGTVAGNGTTEETQVYFFTDQQPIPGIQHYRLRQVDLDGGFEYSEVRTVDFAPNGRRFKATVYPNPMIANDIHIEVETHDLNSPVFLTVRDLSGKAIVEQRISTESGRIKLELDASHMEQGTYLITVQQANQVVSTKRIIKAR